MDKSRTINEIDFSRMIQSSPHLPYLSHICLCDISLAVAPYWALASVTCVFSYTKLYWR